MTSYDVITGARRTRRRLLLGVAGTAVVAAVAVTVWPNPVPQNTSPGASPAADADADADAGAGPDTAASGPADVLPADLAWATIAGLQVPVSATAGPRQQHDGLAAGFAHDPGGAVLAAVHITARTSAQVGPAVFGPTFGAQVVGADAAVMHDSVAREYQQLRAQTGVADGQPLGALSAVLHGYLVEQYTPQAARIRVLTEAYDDTGRPVQAVTRLLVVWTGGDWALQAPPGGSYDASVTAATAEDRTSVRPFTGGR